MEKIKVFLEKSKIYIFSFLIFFLPISKAILEISFTLLFIIWLIEKVILGKRLNEYFPKTELTIPIALILLVCFISIFNSVDPKESIRGFLGKWLEFVMLFFFTIEVVDSKRKFKNILWIFSLSLTLILIDGLWQFIFGKDFLYIGHSKYAGILAEGLWIKGCFTDLNIFGALLVLFSPIVISFLISYKKWHINLYSYLLIILFVFCFIFSNSVESWIALGFSLGLGQFFYGNRKNLKYILLFLLLFWTTTFITPIFRGRMFSLWKAQVTSEDGRVAIWKETFKEIKKNPFLGKGINTTRSSIVKKYSNSLLFIRYPHTHNLYLFILLETGLVGLLVFLWFLWKVIKIIIHFDKDILSYGFFVSIIGFLTVNLVDIIWDERIQSLFWVILGMAVVYKKIKLSIEEQINFI